jgi:hypothetical protein
MLQDVAERSRQKSNMLQGYGDAVLRAEALEEQLVKSRKHAAVMQSKKSKIRRRRVTNSCGRTNLSTTRIKVRDRLVRYLLMVA